MVGVLCRLKLSLIAGGLRGSTIRGLGFATAVVLGLLVAMSGFRVFRLMGLAGTFGANLFVLSCALMVLGFAIVPVLAFRSDETLDPARFALLPLRSGTAAWGLLLAAGIGVIPIMFMIALSGAVAGFATTPGVALMGVAAVASIMVMCLLVGRILPLALAPVLRGRRGTDVMIGGVVAVTTLLLFTEWGVINATPEDLDAILVTLASGARWTPPGMAAQALVDAREYAYPSAAVRIACALLTVIVLGWCWKRLLSRALIELRVAEGGFVVRRSDAGTFGPAWLTGRLGAVLGRELRYQRREPRRKAALMTLVLLCGVILTVLAPLSSGNPGDGTTVLVTSGALTALTLVGNQFGMQGSALWSVMASTSSTRELRSELLGGSLSTVIVGVPMMLVLAAFYTLSTAADPGSLVSWSAVIGATLGGFLLALGVSPLLSVFFPYPLPNRGHNPFAGPGAGQGFVVSLTMTGAMLSVNVLAIPIYLLAPQLDGWTSLPFAVGCLLYGLAVAWGGIALAARWGAPRLPEILAKVSKPVS